MRVFFFNPKSPWSCRLLSTPPRRSCTSLRRQNPIRQISQMLPYPHIHTRPLEIYRWLRSLSADIVINRKFPRVAVWNELCMNSACKSLLRLSHTQTQSTRTKGGQWGRSGAEVGHCHEVYLMCQHGELFKGQVIESDSVRCVSHPNPLIICAQNRFSYSELVDAAMPGQISVWIISSGEWKFQWLSWRFQPITDIF